MEFSRMHISGVDLIKCSLEEIAENPLTER